MIERRDVLKACLAASVLPLVGCSDSREPGEQAAPPGPAPASATSASSKGIAELEIRFKGLALFVFDESRTLVDVGLPVVADPHYSTLRVPRVAVSHKSTAKPVAADEQYVYFNLTGKTLNVIPRDSDDSSAWPSIPPADLVVGRAPISDYLPKDCGDANWNNVKWLIDFKQDLFPGAVLASNWKDKLAGRIELSHGLLESGFEPDELGRFTYEMTSTDGTTKRRLTKEMVRYRIKSNFVEFCLDNDSCVVDTRKRYIDPDAKPLRVSIEHVPRTWMDPVGDLTDFEALYELMDPNEVGKLSRRPVPRARKPCSLAGGSTPGCECCPVVGMFI